MTQCTELGDIQTVADRGPQVILLGRLEATHAPLPAAAVVADIVYAPLVTPLLEAAGARGLRTVDGLGMLLHQAVGAFARFFGARPQVTRGLRTLVEADLIRAATLRT